MVTLTAVVSITILLAEAYPIRNDAMGDPLSAEILQRVRLPQSREKQTITELHYTPSGQHLVAISAHGQVYVMDAVTGQATSNWLIATETVKQTVVTNNVLHLVGLKSHNEMYQKRQLNSGAMIQQFRLEHDTDAIAISSNADRLAYRLGAPFQIRELNDWKHVRQGRFSISDEAPQNLLITNDGKYLAGIFRNWIEVREVATGNMPVGEATPGNENIVAAQFTPSSEELVVLSQSKRHSQLTRYSLLNNQKLTMQLPTESTSKQLHFSPCGRYLWLLTNQAIFMYRWPLCILIHRYQTLLPLTQFVVGKHQPWLVAGQCDDRVDIFDIRSLRRHHHHMMTTEQLNSIWKQFIGSDEAESFHAMLVLAASPNSTVPWLRENHVVFAKPTQQLFRKWIADLDAPDYAIRQNATKEFKQVADWIEPELRIQLRATTSPEVRARIEDILRTCQPDSIESIRRSRIIELLEIGNDNAAIALLRHYAKSSSTIMAREATAALIRLSASNFHLMYD